MARRRKRRVKRRKRQQGRGLKRFIPKRRIYGLNQRGGISLAVDRGIKNFANWLGGL